MEIYKRNLRKKFMKKEDLRIVFMGTPEFATESLKALYEEGFNISAVITAPDKPAGRGKQLQQSNVKKYALENNLKILQPKNLKASEFISELKELNANLQIVVAFRMLPEIVWSMPKFGTINLHASLLPQYRGAAPINHAIMNGEKQTGITTFFIEKEIDTGKIIMQEEVEILWDENAGQLHNKLMYKGGKLIVKTVDALINDDYKAISQKELMKKINVIKTANKIFKHDCEINWAQNTEKIYNFIRGLSPYPGAWTHIKDQRGKIKILKIFSTDIITEKLNEKPGEIYTDNKNYIKITTIDGCLNIKELQTEGKRKMNVKELLNGINFGNYSIK